MARSCRKQQPNSNNFMDVCIRMLLLLLVIIPLNKWAAVRTVCVRTAHVCFFPHKTCESFSIALMRHPMEAFEPTITNPVGIRSDIFHSKNQSREQNPAKQMKYYREFRSTKKTHTHTFSFSFSNGAIGDRCGIFCYYSLIE